MGTEKHTGKPYRETNIQLTTFIAHISKSNTQHINLITELSGHTDNWILAVMLNK